jgi:translation elongation factor EF-Tu-like GTPase
MARLLFKVEDTFVIRGRGLVVVPGIVPGRDERFRIGDALQLKRPDGSESETTIGGLEMFTESMKPDIPVLLKGLGKEDVPIGTEVWSIDRENPTRGRS